MKINNDSASLDTEKLAREFARHQWPDTDIVIVHSPHSDNQHGDYFVEVDKGQMLRTWERSLFMGLGRNA